MQRSQWNKRLLASTRGKIIALLRGEHRTVGELAAELHLTGNAVRAHLSHLEQDGLVQQRGLRSGRRKPHVIYALSAEAEHIFPKAYGSLLNHLIAVISARLNPDGLRSTMREVGKAVARDYLAKFKGRTRHERIQAALELFNDLGGAAKLESRNGKDLIHGRNGCPLAAVTASHPEACLIVESLLTKVVGVPARTCCEYDGIPHCCFEFSAKLRGK